MESLQARDTISVKQSMCVPKGINKSRLRYRGGNSHRFGHTNCAAIGVLQESRYHSTSKPGFHAKEKLSLPSASTCKLNYQEPWCVSQLRTVIYRMCKVLKFMMKLCSAADLLCFLKAAPSESDPVMCTVILPLAEQLIWPLTSARFKGFALKVEVVKCGEMQPSGLDIDSLFVSKQPDFYCCWRSSLKAANRKLIFSRYHFSCCVLLIPLNIHMEKPVGSNPRESSSDPGFRRQRAHSASFKHRRWQALERGKSALTSSVADKFLTRLGRLGGWSDHCLYDVTELMIRAKFFWNKKYLAFCFRTCNPT